MIVAVVKSAGFTRGEFDIILANGRKFSITINRDNFTITSNYSIVSCCMKNENLQDCIRKEYDRRIIRTEFEIFSNWVINNFAHILPDKINDLMFELRENHNVDIDKLARIFYLPG